MGGLSLLHDIVLNLQEQAREVYHTATAGRGAEVSDLTGIDVVVSKTFQQIPCFSSGQPFNAVNGVEDTEWTKKQRWLVSTLHGVDTVSYPACSPGESLTCRHRYPGVAATAGTDVEGSSGRLAG